MSERLPAMLSAYRLATLAATPLASPLLSYRLRRGKEHPARLCERRGQTQIARPPGALVWVHGASVGELTAAIPLIERIKARGFTLLVTSGTVTSASIARQRLPQGVIHQFIPLDAPGFVSRFLDHWRPSLALFVESDLWPNLILASAARGTPLILINGRLSDRSFRRWQRVPRLIEALLQKFDLCLVRSEEDANRFSELGAPRLSVVGNLKLDVPPLPVDDSRLAELTEAVAARALLAAASTHSGEEEVIVKVHRSLKASFPGLLTIIAPRHPQRGPEIAGLVEAAGLSAALRSTGKLPTAATEVYVCDTVGELGMIYRLAPIVFMGGSLVAHGGQNPIEAVRQGAVVLVGPHWQNFSDAYRALISHRGAVEVHSAEEIARVVRQLLSDETELGSMRSRASAALATMSGALPRTIEALLRFLPSEGLVRAS